MATPETPADTSIADAVNVSTSLHSLQKSVYARRSEYTRRHRTRIKVGTWNVAACRGTDKDLARWFVDGEGLDVALGPSRPSTDGRQVGLSGPEASVHLAGSDQIGLYVLGLQEVSVLSAPGQYMTWIYAADTTTVDRWKAAMEAALPEGYQLVAAEQLAGMLLLAYASPEVAPTVSNISTTTVATGALGYLGNKGAVCARMILGETTQLVFVNCHLASGVEEYNLERRINQAQQIVTQARFDPVCIAGVVDDEKSKIGDEDFAFWFGDLNFRLDRLPGDDIRRLLMLHTRGEYDLSKRKLRRESSLDGEPIVVHRLSDSSDEVVDQDPDDQSQENLPDKAEDADDESVELPDPDEFPPDPHEDPASLQSTLDSLLPHDQLRRLIKERRVFHEGWKEGPITFLPTYKYDVGTVALFDSSEKRRPPSWCDRILYRTRRDMEEYERKIREEEEARKKDEEMKARGMEEASDDDQVLFSYDPENDGDEHPSSAGLEYDAYDEAEDDGSGQMPEHSSQNGTSIHLDLYTSHQRITSSDHKPVSSIFTLDYDAVVPELKSKVHAEVARELDRAENEGRPAITIAVDHDSPHVADNGSDSSPHVDFGEIGFLEKHTLSLTLANTGRVPATLSFVETPTAGGFGDKDAARTQWLTPSFVHSEPAHDQSDPVDLGSEVTLEPGETVNAVLDALIDDVLHARMLNEGQTPLEQVLILRVADGRDHFIPVRASWKPTCIGRSVSELTAVPDGGIRAFAKSLAEKRNGANTAPSDLPTRQPVTKEMFKLAEAVEALTQRVLADAQMLEDCAVPSDPGWPFDEATCKSTDVNTRVNHIATIIDALDRDEPISSAFEPETPSIERLEAVSQTLLLFLRGLTDGIITAALWQCIEEAAPSLPSLANPNTTAEDDSALENDRTTVLEILHSNLWHSVCFEFLTTTLARAISELSPLSKAEWELIRNGGASISSSSSSSSSSAPAPARGLGFIFGRRNTNTANQPLAEATAALEKRRARERRVAEVFGPIVCRGGGEVGRERERRAVEERKKALVSLFLGRPGG
ncbi:Endonuclease/exonuclease/phosphatase [Chaetomium strumarium]|uniref:Endonuclease/exonuclease/phosphatase n=1 Tax=Chaetomium strumarium TaxID=1170767 RepID=A0AAJ0M486_9PEZI|nr:Endonuclease/exonuclease/phosphatase [Chaetomium strumarium]